MTVTALVVDDEADLCRLMQITLRKMNINSDVAYSLATANHYLDHNRYDFCLTDLKLPDGSGIELVKRISSSSSAPVAVITAHGNMDLAIEALKLGAFDFVNKPLELPRLRQLVKHALKICQQLNDAQDNQQQSPEQRLLDARLIGDSTTMQQLKATILKLARSQAPVFLWGASGTGKEVVARLIHDLSPRREGHFVPVNCGAIPSELMEAEFFGNKKGSFTGAVADKIGLFQQAHEGTLFLDEVADLPLAMQVKLLRAVQEKSIRAIGDSKEVAVDVRILSATHKDLAQLVQQGKFRQDLFYRINVIDLKMPTLNERGEDIPTLAKHFLTLIAQDWQLASPPTLTDAAYQLLKQHDFEGNVRELRNLLERAVTLSDTRVIDVEQLGITPTPTTSKKAEFENVSTIAKPLASNCLMDGDDVVPNSMAHRQRIAYLAASDSRYRHRSEPTATPLSLTTAQTLPIATTAIAQAKRTTKAQQPSQQLAHYSSSSSSFSSNSNSSSSTKTAAQPLPKQGLEAYLQQQERSLIIAALQQTDGNKTKAAKLLGTTFRSLRYRMKKLHIDEG